MLVKVLKIKDFYEFNFCSNTTVSTWHDTSILMLSTSDVRGKKSSHFHLKSCVFDQFVSTYPSVEINPPAFGKPHKMVLLWESVFLIVSTLNGLASVWDFIVSTLIPPESVLSFSVTGYRIWLTVFGWNAFSMSAFISSMSGFVVPMSGFPVASSVPLICNVRL